MRVLVTALALLLGNVAPPAGSAQGEALAIAQSLLKRDYAATRARFSPKMKAALPIEKLRSTWEPIAAGAGKLARFGDVRTSMVDGLEAVVVTMIFERAAWNLEVVFALDGKVAGLFILTGQRDDWRAPDYGRPPAAEVAVKVGPRALPGTLTLPWAKGPFPAVVLVHGSGPHDADETIGPNRPFADLALGLAARGIASVRYEKRTHAHPGDFAGATTYTVEEETVADAVSAVELAAAAPAVDARRVWVVGHSLGGLLAPRIAARTTKVAGIVILAGPTRALEDIVVDQARTLAGPGSPLAARAESFAAAARDPQLAPDRKVDMLGVPLPGSYFLDLRRYDAASTAGSLKVPVLVLQGERDFQVTRADYDGWAKALGRRPNARLKLYPDLNHLFEAGEGASRPAEYDRPGLHVEGQVVSDVADFINGPRP